MVHGLGLALIVAAACGPQDQRTATRAESAATRAPRRENAGATMTPPPQDSSRHLDLASPTLIHSLAAGGALVGDAKFIDVDVSSVVNPKRRTVTIAVDYAPPTGPRVHLGSFSLFPADNPGKFIVATQGKLRPEGSVVLTLQPPPNATIADTVRLVIRSIRLSTR
jgi:hypothetical protein